MGDLLVRQCEWNLNEIYKIAKVYNEIGIYLLHEHTRGLITITEEILSQIIIYQW